MLDAVEVWPISGIVRRCESGGFRAATCSLDCLTHFDDLIGHVIGMT
jgi:hypothetical protein